MQIREVVLVAAGGGAGALLRYGVHDTWPVTTGSFPTTTLLLNLVGAFALGVVVEIGTRRGGAPAWARPLLGMGALGAFTTFSGFTVEAVQMLDAGRTSDALAYVVLSLVAGVMAATAGLYVTGWRGGMPVPDDGES